MPYLFLHCEKNENIQRVWPILKIIGILLHCFDPYIASILRKIFFNIDSQSKNGKKLGTKQSKDGK